MQNLEQLHVNAKNGDKKSQLALCYYYFEQQEKQKLNELFIPLLQQNYPPAILAKVDFYIQQSPDKGIGLLYQLAADNVPMANYKMAMLLFFHPELTLDFASYLTQAIQLKEEPAILVGAYLFFRLGHPEHAQKLLLKFKSMPEIASYIDILAIDFKHNVTDEHIDFTLLKRPEYNTQIPKMIAAEINLFSIDNFLTPFECLWLKNRAHSELGASYVVNGESGELLLSEVRTGEYAQLLPTMEDWILLDIEQRIAQITGVPMFNGELSNILHYQPGQEYKAHYDFFHPRDPGSTVAMQDGGQRIKTALCYIEPSEAGGETAFPRLDISISGHQGQLIVFNNTTNDSAPLPLSLHQGLPVIKGEKWLLTKWLREQSTSYQKDLLRLNV